MEKVINEVINYTIFFLIAISLTKPGVKRAYCLLTAAVVLAVTAVIQAILLSAGMSLIKVLTLLPLTAYVPAIIGLHVVSGKTFLPTVSAWVIASAGKIIIDAVMKIVLLASKLHGTGGYYTLMLPVHVAVGAVLVLMSFFLLRRPFLGCMERCSSPSWFILCFPVMMLIMLMSYFTESATNITVLVLLLLTAAAVFAVLWRVLGSLIEVEQLRSRREEEGRQLEVQRRHCEDLSERLKLGRSYRHDVRHHLLVLEGLARQNDSAGVLEYLKRLDGRLGETAEVTYCANTAVNAVLAAMLGDAEKAGCTVTADIRLPAQLPFDELDVCVLLANTLENALHACSAAPIGERKLDVKAELSDGGTFTCAIDNSCPTAPQFNAEGLPVVSGRKGHGVGLRSVRSITEKYGGLMSCSWEEGVFRFRAALFVNSGSEERSEAPHRRRSYKPARSIPVVAAVLMIVVLAVNCVPALSEALMDVPVVGTVIHALDGRTYGWGSTEMTNDMPEVYSSELEPERDNFVEEMREVFMSYATQKYDGYVGMDVTSEVLRNDAEYIVVRFTGVLNAGGSGEYSRCVTLDKATGGILQLSDLFVPGSDYIGVISADIIEQMTAEVEAGTGDYFVPGSIWSEEEHFKSIAPDQDFYVNTDGDLVILFDEYEVAPGSMGTPEFTVSREVFEHILA